MRPNLILFEEPVGVICDMLEPLWEGVKLSFDLSLRKISYTHKFLTV